MLPPAPLSPAGFGRPSRLQIAAAPGPSGCYPVVPARVASNFSAGAVARRGFPTGLGVSAPGGLQRSSQRAQRPARAITVRVAAGLSRPVLRSSSCTRCCRSESGGLPSPGFSDPGPAWSISRRIQLEISSSQPPPLHGAARKIESQSAVPDSARAVTGLRRPRRFPSHPMTGGPAPKRV